MTSTYIPSSFSVRITESSRVDLSWTKLNRLECCFFISFCFFYLFYFVFILLLFCCWSLLLWYVLCCAVLLSGLYEETIKKKIKNKIKTKYNEKKNFIHNNILVEVWLRSVIERVVNVRYVFRLFLFFLIKFLNDFCYYFNKHMKKIYIMYDIVVVL